jgi:hypothetical protein
MISSFQAAAHDHFCPERLALAQHKVQVVSDLEDTIESANAGEGTQITIVEIPPTRLDGH